MPVLLSDTECMHLIIYRSIQTCTRCLGAGDVHVRLEGGVASRLRAGSKVSKVRFLLFGIFM